MVCVCVCDLSKWALHNKLQYGPGFALQDRSLAKTSVKTSTKDKWWEHLRWSLLKAYRSMSLRVQRAPYVPEDPHTWGMNRQNNFPFSRRWSHSQLAKSSVQLAKCKVCFLHGKIKWTCTSGERWQTITSSRRREGRERERVAHFPFFSHIDNPFHRCCTVWKHAYGKHTHV